MTNQNQNLNIQIEADERQHFLKAIATAGFIFHKIDHYDQERKEITDVLYQLYERIEAA